MACPDFQSLTLPVLQSAAGGQELTLAALRALALARIIHACAHAVPEGGWSRSMGRQRRLEEPLKRDRFAPTAREAESLGPKPSCRQSCAYRSRLRVATPSVSVRMAVSSVRSVDQTPGDQ